VVLFFALLKQRPRSPSRLVLRTPAKVNLALEVLRKRPDGYHELSTVLQAVDLCDRLTVETADTITLETSEPGLPTDERNLLVLVNPGVPLSTQEVYGRVPPGWQAEPEGTKRVVEALRTRNVAKLAAALTNHLERWAEPAMPVIGRMKAALLAAGTLGAVMSGSGPTGFGMARSLDQAQQIQRRVNRAGWAAWAVRTNSGAAIRAI